LNAAGSVRFKFRDQFVDNDRHICTLVSRSDRMRRSFKSREHRSCWFNRCCARDSATAQYLTVLLSRSGSSNLASFTSQNVVGAAGGLGIHGFQADAGARSAPEASRVATKRRRSPLPKMTNSTWQARASLAQNALFFSCFEVGAVPEDIGHPMAVDHRHWHDFFCTVHGAPSRGHSAVNRLTPVICVGLEFHAGVPGAVAGLQDVTANAARRFNCGQIVGLTAMYPRPGGTCAYHSQISQAGQRALRHPWPDHGCGSPDGGRGPEDHQAEHGQPGAVFGFDAP
jgi:hypothetical protein